MMQNTIWEETNFFLALAFELLTSEARACCFEIKTCEFKSHPQEESFYRCFTD